MSEARLQVKGQRVVDRMADALGRQKRLELVTPGDLDGVLVKNVVIRGIHSRWADVRVTGEGCRVACGVLLAGLIPGVQVRQFCKEYGRLQRVQPAIGPDLLVHILARTPVQAKAAQPGCQGIILGYHQTCVTPGTKILGWKERQGAHGAELARSAPSASDLATSSDGLGSIFDQCEPMASSEREDFFHRRHLSKQMDDDNGASTRGNRRL